MEEISNKLEVTIEDGTTVTVNVLDFVDSLEFGKTYIIYTYLNKRRRFDDANTAGNEGRPSLCRTYADTSR